MTNPDTVAILRNVRIPAAMVNSEQLRDFLLEKAECGDDSPPAGESRLLNLVVASHLEILNVLGALEEGLAAETQKKIETAYEEFKENLVDTGHNGRQERGFFGFLGRI